MPTVAPSSSPPQRPPPGDADLQDLYDQVLSAFAEESSPSNFSPTYSINRPHNVDHDPPYSPHSDDAVGAHISSRAHPQTRGWSSFTYFLLHFLLIFLSPFPLQPAAPASPRDNNRPLPSPTAFPTSPTLGKGPRPLPRLPGASPTANYPTHMPEPRPAGAKPSPEQCVTPLTILPSSSSSPTCRSRRPYAADAFINGTATSPAERPPRGLPSDPRQAQKIPATLRPGSSSGVDARSPSPGPGHTRGANSVQYPMPVPDPSHAIGSYNQPWIPSSAGRNYPTNGAQSPGSALAKKPSYRPPGASAPRIPGHVDDFSTNSPSADPYSPMSNASSSYFPHDANYASNLSKIPPPPPLNPPANAQTPPRPKNTLERDTSDDILAPGTHGFAPPLSHSEFSHPFFLSRYLLDRPDRHTPPSASSSEHPLRSTSTVSTTSSTQPNGLERNLTASTVATISTAYSSPSSREKDVFVERTPIERGDSFSSKLRDYSSIPTPVSERQPSEAARSEVTARSRLASEIERLKSREAMEDATNSYADDEFYEDDEEYYSEEESLDSFVNFSLLSNIAVWLRDQVPRGTHVKGSIPYPRAFTGRDIVVCSLPHLFALI